MWNMKCFVNHWGHGNCKWKFKKYMETIPGQNSTDSLQKKNSCTWNITHHKERATIWDLKLKWSGSPLAQKEKYLWKENLW
jgi:hypothetical protein